MKLIQLSNVDNSRIVGLVLENKFFNIKTNIVYMSNSMPYTKYDNNL